MDAKKNFYEKSEQCSRSEKRSVEALPFIWDQWSEDLSQHTRGKLAPVEETNNGQSLRSCPFDAQHTVTFIGSGAGASGRAMAFCPSELGSDPRMDLAFFGNAVNLFSLGIGLSLKNGS